MNISEDKFANKSADQIVKDVLEQHKQNAQDALAYIQNVTADDGLSLSKETKARLKKAEDMLVNRVKRENLVEKRTQTYDVNLEIHGAWRPNIPAMLQPPCGPLFVVNDVKSLNDPKVEKACRSLLKTLPPQSVIIIRSDELGDRVFHESISDNNEQLTEKFWPFKKKAPEPQRYEARMICCPPFKKEPLEVMLPPITSVDDPIVDQYVQLIRKKHPHSPIMLRSEAGWKTFYENTNHEYTVKAYNKEGKIVESKAGNLPIAMGLSEKLYESNNYNKIEVLKENKTISTYKGLKEGWLLEDKKTPDEEDFEYNYYKNEKDQNKLNKSKKSYKLSKADTKNSDFWTKLGNDVLNTNLAQTAGQAGLSALTGINPALLGGATHALTNYLLNKHNIETTRKNKLKDLKAKYDITEDFIDPKNLKGLMTTDDLSSDKIDLQQNYADITNRLLYTLSGIHPSLDDTRKPKIQWPNRIIKRCPLLKIPSLVPERYFVLGGFVPSKDVPRKKELVDILSQINNLPEELEAFKNEYLDGKKDKVVLYPKVAIEENGFDKNGNQLYIWKVDTKNPIKIPVNLFKAFLEEPENADTMEKFNNKHPEDLDERLTDDLQAVNTLADKYPDWEAKYSDIYDLDRFDLVTRTNIYKDWRDASVNNTIHTGRELTKEEIDEKYYYPILKKQLKINIKNEVDQNIYNGIKALLGQIPEFKREELYDYLYTLTDEIAETTNKQEISRILNSAWNNVFSKYYTEYYINYYNNNKLYNIEKGLNEVNSKNLITFEKDKDNLIKNYTVSPKNSNKNIQTNTLNNLAMPDVVKIKYENSLKSHVDQLNIKYTKDTNKPILSTDYQTIKSMGLDKRLEKDVTIKTKSGIKDKIFSQIQKEFDDNEKYEKWKNTHTIKIFNSKEEFDQWKNEHENEITLDMQFIISTLNSENYKEYGVYKFDKAQNLVPVYIPKHKYRYTGYNNDYEFVTEEEPLEFSVSFRDKQEITFKSMEDFEKQIQKAKKKNDKEFFSTRMLFNIDGKEYRWGSDGKLKLIPKTVTYKNNDEFDTVLQNKYVVPQDEILKQAAELKDKYEELPHVTGTLDQVLDMTGLQKHLEPGARSRTYKRIASMKGDDKNLNGAYNFVKKVVDKIKSLEKRKVDMDSDEAKQELNALLRNIATDTEDIGSSHDKILKHINVSSFGDWLDSTDD